MMRTTMVAVAAALILATSSAAFAQVTQPSSVATPSVTLSEANAMSPSALAERLLADQPHRPIVDAIVNSRGMAPPSASVQRVWLVEQMTPFKHGLCRSHGFEIEMEGSDPAASLWREAVPTRPKKVTQYDRLWVPPTEPATAAATAAACAAAPARTSGFGDGGFGIERAAMLVEQARSAFRSPMRRTISVQCRAERGACGKAPKKTLAAIPWNSLGLIEAVAPNGERLLVGGPGAENGPEKPYNVRFTFPYAAGGHTWVVTVRRAPQIVNIQMEAISIIYH